MVWKKYEVFETITFTTKDGETLTGKVESRIETECGPNVVRWLYEVRIGGDADAVAHNEIQGLTEGMEGYLTEGTMYEVEADQGTPRGRKFTRTYID